MEVKNKKIGFVLTGSFCTFSKTIPKMKELIDKGAEVIPVMSYNSYSMDTKFGKAKDFTTFYLCQNEHEGSLHSTPIRPDIREAPKV